MLPLIVYNSDAKECFCRALALCAILVCLQTSDNGTVFYTIMLQVAQRH